ncbi:MAG TPA: hypothetical protein DD477_11110 [Spirochaetaceae bacterium]|nr:hypothetical protein [Spirochaetaceae bacterium]HAW85247.1 hypothetical protein [Spirochaetaceae bacterium]HAX38341.1 hypothetical protein [Spirochaetaceae bacterium]HBO41746.1 hypothetical protein [Spirochaetaceae bacterium]HCQ86199.1 hypothetical protein [Spirochaetaceae bacterium]
MIGLVCLLALSATLWAQDPTVLVESYRRNFARASLATKLDLLQEAAAFQNMGPLYETALQFVLDNASLLQTDVLLRDISILSVNMLRQFQQSSAAGLLMNLFKSYRETAVRVPVLQALSELGAGNKPLLAELNNVLDTQNSLFSSGVPADNQVLDALIFTIGQLGDASSFRVLFSAFIAGYSRGISASAVAAMANLDGDFGNYLTGVIQDEPVATKLSALQVGLSGDALPAEQRGALAEAALLVSVTTQPASNADQQALSGLAVLAARELTRLGWQRASTIAVRHFYDFQTRFNRNQITKSDFLEAVALLGAMGTAEAAQALAIYLQLINTETEQGSKTYDEQIVLAVINNLGNLGDKAAFDYLLYVGYLQYSETIKRAARDALQKLRW